MNENFDPPIWIRAGMDQSAYAALPWPKKRTLLMRHGWGFGIYQICPDCKQRVYRPPRVEESPLGGWILDSWLNTHEGRRFLSSENGRRWLVDYELAKINTAR